MSKTIKLVMELTYNIDTLGFLLGEDIPENEFRERVLDYANEDVHDYLCNYDMEEIFEVIEID